MSAWRSDPTALEREWSDLLTRSAADGPFLSPLWLRPWWRAFGPTGGRRAAAFALRDGGRLIGFAPLVTRTHWYRPGLPFRRLELWGSGEPEADSICTDYLTPIAERGREAEVAARFAAEAVRRRWDEFVIPRMDGTGPMPSLLTEAFRRCGLSAELTAEGEAVAVALPGTWDGYLSGLSGRERYLVRRTLRDFDVWADGRASWHEAADSAGVREGSAILSRLHNERWDGGGTFRSTRFGRFHDEAMAGLLKSGALWLAWLSVGGEPVAAMYSVRWGTTVSFYQCGRKLEVPKGVRPGLALLAQAIRRATEGGMTAFDFLGGAARYKSDLGGRGRPLLELRAVRPGLRERLRQGIEWSKERLRWWRKSATIQGLDTVSGG